MIAAAQSNTTPMIQVLRGFVLVDCTGTRVMVTLIVAWKRMTINKLPSVPLTVYINSIVRAIIASA